MKWCDTQGEATPKLNKQENHSWLAVLCSMSTTVWIALLAAWAYVELLSPAPQGPFLLTCFPASCLPSVPVSGILVPQVQLLPLPLLNFILLMIVQCFKVPRSHCKASHSFRESAAPRSLGSLANLLKSRSSPAFRSLIKILNWYSGLATELSTWETPLVTGYQRDLAPLTINL